MLDELYSTTQPGIFLVTQLTDTGYKKHGRIHHESPFYENLTGMHVCLHILCEQQHTYLAWMEATGDAVLIHGAAT